MKKHVWMDYGAQGETLELTIRDYSGAKIESWKVGTADKKRIKQIFKKIQEKYSVNLFFDLKEDRDLDWML